MAARSDVQAVTITADTVALDADGIYRVFQQLVIQQEMSQQE